MFPYTKYVSLHGLPQQLYFEISKETVPHALICICSFPYAICLLDKWQCAIMGNHRSGKLAAKPVVLEGLCSCCSNWLYKQVVEPPDTKDISMDHNVLSYHKWTFIKVNKLPNVIFSFFSVIFFTQGNLETSFQCRDSAQSKWTSLLLVCEQWNFALFKTTFSVKLWSMHCWIRHNGIRYKMYFVDAF